MIIINLIILISPTACGLVGDDKNRLLELFAFLISRWGRYRTTQQPVLVGLVPPERRHRRKVSRVYDDAVAAVVINKYIILLLIRSRGR